MKESYHFIGIGGIGMSGLARILLSQNISVTGSDIAASAVVESLKKEGAVIFCGHDAANIPPHSIVVYSSDIKPDNPEYQAALQHKNRMMHRADLLAALVHEKRGMAVAGTHGKTTTSALLATVLVEAGWDPSFAIGGILPAYQCNASPGQGEYFVFEADESDRSFLKFHPWGAIVTNIDNDHLVNYEGKEEVLVKAFQTFISQVKSTEHLFWCRDDAYLTELNMPGKTYGFHPSSDWRILSLEQNGFSSILNIENEGVRYAGIETAMAGRHNALNAAAVFGIAFAMGMPEAAIRVGLKSFKGTLRRCERKGEYKNILFIDDYAHHPVEIKTTLEGIRKAIGKKRLIAVFQPHRYTRTKDCLGMYGSIFDSADEIILTDIFGAGEEPIQHISSDNILKEIQGTSSVPCRYTPRANLKEFLSHLIKAEDVVVTLGAGDITKVGPEMLAMLEQRR